MAVIEEKAGQAGLPTPNSTESFWHSEPSKVLLGHRTTSLLPSKADVVIIGSGIAGSSAAHWLKESDAGKDLEVVMLEAREACWGATGRNGGHCQPLLYLSPPEVGAFELKTYENIKSLIEENNIQCDWKSLTACHAYMNEEAFVSAVKSAELIKAQVPSLGQYVSIVTKDSVNPSLSDLRVPTASGAITTTKAASLWPYKLVSWILENLLSQNNSTAAPKFNLQTTTPVTRLQKTTSSDWIVHTPRGQIVASKVLLTTNAYTSHLLPSFSDLIVPVRGEMSSLLPPHSMTPSSSENPPLDYSYGIIGHGAQNVNRDDYLTQRPFSSSTQKGGELMFGGGREFAVSAGVGISDDSVIDPPAADYLRRELPIALDLKNEQKELKASYEWSGIMGFSRDNWPWVGCVPEELGGGDGLYVCAGFTGHGMPTTRLSAKAAVGIMLGEKEVDLPMQYRISQARIDSARLLDVVKIADEKGAFF
ncbi:hypothetical protein ACMFMG_007419 [Clarireedia jacksonii]